MPHKEQHNTIRTVRVMADYCSSGLWDADGVSMSLDDVPMSAGLKSRLTDWCAAYDTMVDDAMSKESVMDWVEDFSKQGLLIAKALKAEQPSWKVMYFDEAALTKHLDEGGHSDRAVIEYPV